MADETTSYEVLSPLKHGGKKYLPVEGKVVKVALYDEEAATLKELGVVGDVKAKAGKSAA